MKIYAARIAETKDFVGVFWGRNFDEVMTGVDECTSPFDCEYVKIRRTYGGVFCPNEAFPVPDPDGTDDSYERPEARFVLSDWVEGSMDDGKWKSWQDLLPDNPDLHWRKLDARSDIKAFLGLADSPAREIACGNRVDGTVRE